MVKKWGSILLKLSVLTTKPKLNIHCLHIQVSMYTRTHWFELCIAFISDENIIRRTELTWRWQLLVIFCMPYIILGPYLWRYVLCSGLKFQYGIDIFWYKSVRSVVTRNIYSFRANNCGSCYHCCALWGVLRSGLVRVPTVYDTSLIHMNAWSTTHFRVTWSK